MDYTEGNSHKQRQEAEAAEVPEKEVTQIVDTKVVAKEKGLGHKFKRIFFGGEFKSASRYILGDVLLPAARNAVVDATTKGIERMVYGEEASRNRSNSHPAMTSRVEYNRRPNRSRSVVTHPDQPPNRMVQVAQRDAKDVVFGSREEATRVLDHLITIADQYEVTSAADLYQLCGLPVAHIDHKWGWAFLGDARIRQTREGYILEMPPMEEI